MNSYSTSAPADRSSDEAWWRGSTVYQIYPASFCDSNGDGVGDIPGIISKLNHLQTLGVSLLWLSPVYASPMIDNGYDISDYQSIYPAFGTLDDMDQLILTARSKNIGIMMDLVVNHTSDQHRWFEEARSHRQNPYREFYIWRDAGPEGAVPNDLQSVFGGSAWTLDGGSGQYYFHQFAAAQPDLNWTNPSLRKAIYSMMQWWLDRGVAGFRMDVIDLIGKEIDQKIIADGPLLHPLLQEMHQAVLATNQVVTVGETWSATPHNALLYSDPERRELSMVFQFEHVTAFWDPTFGKWQPRPVDLVELKAIFGKWQAALHERGWNSLFWSNHDLPRAVSRYGDDGEHRIASAKMLATVLHLMQGTPFVYQGEEIGMTNAGFADIRQYRDLETLNFYEIQTAHGQSKADFLQGARANSRDNARTPMQWTAATNAGFTAGTPWLEVNANYPQVNVENDSRDPQGVFQRYRQLIELRKRLAVIRDGDFRMLLADHSEVFAYQRSDLHHEVLVIANFTRHDTTAEFDFVTPFVGIDAFTSTEAQAFGAVHLSPYETLVIIRSIIDTAVVI
jgi:oligo-1,6-glucosidase